VELGGEGFGRVAPVAQLGEALSEGEPEQVSGLQEGAKSELVEAAALDEREEDAVAVGQGSGQGSLRQSSGAGAVPEPMWRRAAACSRAASRAS
jgi:hypothetical protein